MACVTTQEKFEADIAAKIGTADQAIAYALSFEDYHDLHQFMSDWETGVVATDVKYAFYWMWLRGEIAI